ncbi:uncharacterized protein EV422DRAFT_521334 [Fimicolochytrium jonesii]|uniref:uncharacterized protein n=1 Tax=Fimicolochytrium jonesii TaxID=1396493 RepID=UPI0022FEA8A8|nr:uncharacterized protein EV422DRAFT_521334 [Fimicolochytrium jonesii]KAI8823532.1 hypothetical protein EV422DRAFT_521334 [Fimicolochytrium jonesii]
MSASQDSPSGRKRTGGGNQSLRPVTIKQLLDAKQTVPDGPHAIDGQELSQCAIVGVISDMHQQSTHISYIIDDGTGTIEVKKFWDKDESDLDAERRDVFQKSSYVRATGHLRVFNQKKSLIGFNLRPVDTPDEIAFHMLDTTFVHLYLTKGPLNGGQQQQNIGGAGYMDGQNATAYGQSAYAPNNGGAAGIYGNNNNNNFGGGNEMGGGGNDMYTPLQNQIIQFVRQYSNTQDGAPIMDIVQRMRGKAAEPEIRNAVNWLCSEGMFYSTTDEDHVKTTSDY